MCCLLEKEPIVKRREAYSPFFQLHHHPKRLVERDAKYTFPGIAHGKLLIRNWEYSAAKKKRPPPVAASRSPHGDYWPAEARRHRHTEARQLLRKRDLTLVDLMRANRAEAVQILSAIICAAMLFSLASSFLFGVQIVNPIPALLILVTFIGFFVMAKAAERSHGVDR